jgi:DNA-binding NarL/FixJ family response regulator
LTQGGCPARLASRPARPGSGYTTRHKASRPARPRHVLRAAERGIPTDQIAARLWLSPATVRNYLSNAISKVGGRNRIDAIRIARDAGWL